MPQSFADQFGSIPMSSNLGASLERAHGFAREQGHASMTLEHLLLAFTEDPDASAVLEASTVDLDRLATDVSGYLGRLLEDMRAETGAEPHIDPELLRVLHAAVQAAQQSRRRHIDGAIVLAAVVGDGKSPAAGLLKAHGLTFEEAIRALQKANAKATAQARSKQFAASPPAAPSAQPSPAVAENGSGGAPHAGASLEPLSVREPQATGQSVDDILAAARARIQQRTAAIVRKPEPFQESPASAAEPEPPQVSRLESPPPPQRPPPPPQAESTVDPPSPQGTIPADAEAASGPRSPRPGPSRTPAKDQAPARPGQPVSPRAQPPFPPWPPQSGEGPPRPPLPQNRSGPSAPPPQSGLPPRLARAPWPDANEPAPHPRPPAPNGALTDAAAPSARRPVQRTGGQGGQGPLIETIPRRMRVGATTTAQVRINRDRVDGLILLLMKGRGMAHRPDALVTRALSVKLRAPDGGFWIEATSPETQWVETVPGLHQDEHVSWRWDVTPQHRGRGRLVLVVTARTVGRDGLAAEISPPDRSIEVTVTGGRLRALARWGGLAAAMAVGAILSRFGNELWVLGGAILRKIAG